MPRDAATLPLPFTMPPFAHFALQRMPPALRCHYFAAEYFYAAISPLDAFFAMPLLRFRLLMMMPRAM